MNFAINLIAVSLVATLACLMTSVTTSPAGSIQPTIPLNQMEPDHACLFICSICFPDLEDSEHLVDCSNRVCGPVEAGMCAMERFIWLGHHCRHYDMVENMWSSH